jgi:hypothetical protein
MSSYDDNDHDTPDLIGLLAGELGRGDSLAAAHHLETCDSCRRQLVDLVVAHAALRSSDRTERLLRVPDVGVGTDADPDDAELPPLALNGDGETDGGPAVDHPARRGGLRRWPVVAAAVVVLVVALAAAVGSHGRYPAPQGPVTTAALRPLDAPAGTGGSIAVYARGTTRTLTVSARDLPAPPGHHFYEVWLLDPSTAKMLPMGVLAPSGHASYSVEAAIMSAYSAVDVSLQADDGDPAHSRTSVLRAVV